MKKIQQQNNITDVMWKECNRDDFATQITGIKQIDCILAGYWISDCVVKACYKLFKY